MSASRDDRPSYVRALEKEGLEILSWGGNEQAGLVEWRSHPESIIDGEAAPHRNCRRWHVINGQELGHTITMTEREIELSDGVAWRETMRKSALEFQAALRKKQLESAPVRRRR